MQIFALEEKNLIFIDRAQRKGSYCCPLCHGELGVKKGKKKRNHFFHLSRSNCLLSQKNGAHLATQMRLAHFLPEKALEVSFPEIHRIADVYWKEKKIVFEVQCSSITFEEIFKRQSDYQKIGLEIIWVFHTKKFTREIKKNLPGVKHFFTDVTEKGKGSFFDFDEEGKKVPPFSSDDTTKSIRSWRSERKSLYSSLLYAFLIKGALTKGR